MTTMLDQVTKAGDDYAAALRRKDDHSTWVWAEVSRRSIALAEIIGRKSVEFTASLDGRFHKLDPKEPRPDIRSRQYKVERSGPYEHLDNKYSVSIQVWEDHATWDGPYRPGKPGWGHVHCWHALQVLEYLAKDAEKPNAHNPKDAMKILLNLCERLASEKKLSDDEIEALHTLQHSGRDSALYR